ncbi:hypothetical protein RPHASCH2410_PD03980 (plasmid) [Rhizobium phaseoli Ch24-10]|nr:hypothetical protein RPHASCH2410_PD03980 [Rhizobium phaseoli Ch24-10]
MLLHLMTLLSTAGGDRERYEAHTGAQKLSAIEFANGDVRKRYGCYGKPYTI